MSGFTDAIRPAVVLTVLMTALTGIAYPLVVTGAAQALFPREANGSLVRDARGQVRGSALIGQGFTGDRYFHPRPSAAGKGYDAASSGATNLAPASRDLHDRMAKDVAALRAAGVTGPIPADLVTTSASGLDPDLSPAAALAQMPRVARARRVPEAQVRAAIERATERPPLALLGPPRVNVLALNRQLDLAAATPGR